MEYTLLVVEDERYTREGILVSCDWPALGIGKVVAAQNGREALNVLETRPVNILLSDIVMPEIQGLELCEIVSRRFPWVLTFLLTGHSDFEYARGALRSGVQDYILKPVDSEELAAAMSRAVAELDKRGKRLRQADRLKESMKDSQPEEVRRMFLAFCEDAFSDWASLKAIKADPPKLHPAVQQVLSYLKEHIADENLSLGRIAETQLFLNSDYLGKLFKREMGVKFSTYLLDQRIRLARDYIRSHPGALVYEIAEAVGFGSNPSYFSALFRRVTGQSPTEYKD